jgi:hypothetical protein
MHLLIHLLMSSDDLLLQDCVFLKQPGFAETNWHSDLRMAPLDTNDFVTAWIPLRPLQGGQQDSGLTFAVGSHRDFALPFWHDLQGRDLGDRGYKLDDTGRGLLQCSTTFTGSVGGGAGRGCQVLCV